MARNKNSEATLTGDEDVIQDRPAASLLKSWGKRMADGGVAGIPVFIGGKWSIAVPRGNKRVLQLAIDNPGVKTN